MKTIRRLIYGEVLAAIALVALGFLALFFFFDLVDELQYLGKNAAGAVSNDDNTYQIRHALLYVALLIPSHLYELVPISVLIGTIFVMARLAQSSEYTILRTSGLGPWRALKTLLMLGLAFVALTFAIGDYVSPIADRTAQLLKARYTGRVTRAASPSVRPAPGSRRSRFPTVMWSMCAPCHRTTRCKACACLSLTTRGC